MALTILNPSNVLDRGSVPNDNTGDTLRSAAGKINTNFEALDSAVTNQTWASVDSENSILIYKTNKFVATNKFKVDSNGNATIAGNITITGSATIDGRNVSADGAKLDGIEAGATGDQTAQEILALLSTIDSNNSGLNAATLDGQEGTHYLDFTNATNKPDPKIVLLGDLSGSVTLTDLADSNNLVATINPNSVTLGTDTTGNYVATIAGTTNEIEVSGSGSETAAVTIGLPNDVTVTNLSDQHGDVRDPRFFSVTGNSTIEEEGVYYVTNSPTLTLGDLREGTIMSIYNNDASSIQLDRGSTMQTMRIAATNATTNYTTVYLRPYTTSTITCFIGSNFVSVAGTGVFTTP